MKEFTTTFFTFSSFVAGAVFTLALALGQQNQAPGQGPPAQRQDPRNQSSTQSPLRNGKDDVAGPQQNPNTDQFHDFSLTHSVQALFAELLGVVAFSQIFLLYRQNNLFDQRNRLMNKQRVQGSAAFE